MPNPTSPLLARQPILNRSFKIVGYELLCRPIPEDSIEWQNSHGDTATSEVLIATFNDIGIQEVTNGLPAYINFTQYWLHNPPLLGTNMVVAEVLEYIPATKENISAIQNLKKKGYKIALDDYLGNPEQDAFFPHLHVVKIDIRQLASLAEIPKIIERQKDHKITWLAEKVETIEEFEFCKQAGCSLFQGYFFSKPTNIYGKRLPDSHHAVLQLLHLLNNQAAAFEDIANVLKTDPQLSYKILKTVNSAAFAAARPITSVTQALMFLGLDQLRAWANVIALGRLNHKPDVLREHAVIRAFLSQSLAMYCEELDSDTAFTIGLLSLLPGFLDASMEKICQELNLSEPIVLALTQQKGPYGFILQATMAMEQGAWDLIDWQLFKEKGATSADIENHYIKALKETRQLLFQMQQDISEG